MLSDFSLVSLLIACGAFLAGGLVKGVIGLALPLVVLSLITSVFGVPQSVALVTLPVLVSNIWQSGFSSHMAPALRRFWPLLLALVVTIVPSTRLLLHVDARFLQALVGIVILAWAAMQSIVPHLSVPARHELWMGPLVGMLGGLLGGVSGLFGPPVAMYMVALHLPKDVFITSVGLAFFAAAVPLTIMLVVQGVFTTQLVALSAAACVPTALGLLAGEWLRRRVDQALFRRLAVLSLVLLGLNLLREAAFG